MPAVAITTVEAIIEGIKIAPSLISTALLLIGMLKSGTLTEDQMLTIWGTMSTSVSAAEAKWRSTVAPSA